MADEEQSQQTAATITFSPLASERDKDEFEALYANNIQVEHSVWDLKVIFGILDLSDAQKPKVTQHTSVNLPWSQVKLMSYYLRVAVALHESQNGKIPIPPSVVPADPATIPIVTAPMLPELKEEIVRLHREFIASM